MGSSTPVRTTTLPKPTAALAALGNSGDASDSRQLNFNLQSADE
jgi:hypothetical protein